MFLGERLPCLIGIDRIASMLNDTGSQSADVDVEFACSWDAP